MPKIWAVVKDIGGTMNLLPVVKLLRGFGHDLTIFLHRGGKGGEALLAAKENFFIEAGADDIVQEHGVPDLLVTDMSSGGGIGRDLIPLCRDMGTPTAALQDTWGMRLGVEFADPKFRPDLICVNDKVGAGIVRDVWGSDRQIAITGYPYLDTLADFDRQAAAKRAREKYGITDNLPVLLYSGQVWHSGRMLKELVEALNQFERPCHLLISEHPRMASEAPAEEQEMWAEACGALKNGTGHLSAKSDLDTIAASNAVIGQYTTTLVNAAVMGVDAIAMLYPEYGSAEYARETGGVPKRYPLVTLGAAEEVPDWIFLRRILKEVLRNSDTDPLGMRRYQREAFRVDGGNAARTVEAILGLLK